MNIIDKLPQEAKRSIRTRYALKEDNTSKIN